MIEPKFGDMLEWMDPSGSRCRLVMFICQPPDKLLWTGMALDLVRIHEPDRYGVSDGWNEFQPRTDGYHWRFVERE